jgi:hypothetical protein
MCNFFCVGGIRNIKAEKHCSSYRYNLTFNVVLFCIKRLSAYLLVWQKEMGFSWLHGVYAT